MSSKLVIVVLLLSILGGALKGQSLTDSLLMRKMQASTVSDDMARQKKGVAFALLRFYKNNISDQIINDCIYEVSCSEFSHHLFENYNGFKSVFLTLDRLSRCNRLSYQETPVVRINSKGKIIDRWEEYQLDF